MLRKDIGQVSIGDDEVHFTIVVNCEVQLSTDISKLFERKYLRYPDDPIIMLVI